MKLPTASVPIALASAVSLGAQVLFSLVMLRLFSPESVGEFSVVSQIAFFWMTLALAQSPLKLLADVHRPPLQALRAALGGSLLRWGLLLPVAVLAVYWSALPHAGQMFVWLALLALLQMGWYLAQPLTLRTASPRSIALGRAVPPVVALTVVAVAAGLWPQGGSTPLLLAAACAYGVGALWLLPAVGAAAPRSGAAPATAAPSVQFDNRSTALRLTHTTADAVLAVAILLVWQRSHGTVQAGYLALLLRLLGFVPTVIHTAWAQVLLSQGTRPRLSPLWVGSGGAAITGLLGLLCVAAVQMNLLTASWFPIVSVLLPVVLWQAAACLLAACSYLPFQQGRASAFSYAAIGVDALQLLVLVAPLLLDRPVAVTTHAWWLGGASTLGLMALSFSLLRARAQK